MINSRAIKEIANIFIGETEKYYNYKKGTELVEFFNDFFSSNDVYHSQFPSRWLYVHDKLTDLINENKIDSFFTLILSKEYFAIEQKISDIDALNQSYEVYKEFNKILKPYSYTITKKDNQYKLVKIDEDLKFISSGGFANVYYQKSTGYVVKKLKDDHLIDGSIISRFKREYNITKSLADITQVVKVIDFDESSFSYRMEKAEATLEEYIKGNEFDDNTKISIISQILNVMQEVHKRDIIHRDLSPNNIFFSNSIIKVADFGLGKDLNLLSSHQTMNSAAVGQFYYCAPEQFMLLKDGDKRSDVFALGRVLNFIMTKSPLDSNHQFKIIVEKATNDNAEFRYVDAGDLKISFEKSLKYNLDSKNSERIWKKISNFRFDNEVESYIYGLSSEKLCKHMLDDRMGFQNILISFMELDDKHAKLIIENIKSGFNAICEGSFSANDVFATFSYKIIREDFSYTVKEIAASILNYIAFDVNRFSAQRLIDNLFVEGVEPMIEDILKG
ncbi:protein kinase domain-containing protein [Lactococcus raffinolactis]|uniref:protein kinase domain-containing protein n=1 Tax=Pseudolactococcus raffinolactis TaxID=1366 RepID=UPI001436B897|nr:protein kinase [Lactococcus raffinolactis]QIW52137.1 protein kinase [Lactococcus raffinolactis]